MKSISPQTLHSLLQSKSDVVLIDVRDKHDYSRLHVPGVHLLPLRQISAVRIRALSERIHEPIYVFCEHGYRARQAIEVLAQEGFHDAILVEGGTHAWVEFGLPVFRAVGASALSIKAILLVEALVLLLGLSLGYTVHVGFLFTLLAVAVALAAFHDWQLPSLTAPQSRA